MGSKDTLKDTSKEHKDKAPVKCGFAIVTMSDTRTIEEDTAGRTIKEMAEKKGHEITLHRVVKDDMAQILGAVMQAIDDDKTNIIVTNGGTGIAKKDLAIESIRQLLEKEISAFGPLFAQLSYGSVGSAALVSRAMAGIVGNTAVFCVPGSPRACQLAMEKLILPEAGHIVKHLGD